MKNLQFMAWIDEFIKHRKSKTDTDDASTKHSNEGTQIDDGVRKAKRKKKKWMIANQS